MKNEHGRAPAARRGPRGVALDPDGLPRRGRPHLHARGARVLPARAALGRGAGKRAVGESTARPRRRSAASAAAAITWAMELAARTGGLVTAPRSRSPATTSTIRSLDASARAAGRLVVRRHRAVRVVAATGANGTGALMVAAGFAGSPTGLSASDDDLLFTIGIALDALFPAIAGTCCSRSRAGACETRAERLDGGRRATSSSRSCRSRRCCSRPGSPRTCATC